VNKFLLDNHIKFPNFFLAENKTLQTKPVCWFRCKCLTKNVMKVRHLC